MKALIADHSRTARRILREMAADIAPDIEIDSAQSGGEAIQLHARNSYDLIFLDDALPDLESTAALATLRRSDPRVLLALLTSSEDPAAADARRAGATCVIVKPYSSLDIQGVFAPLTGRKPAVRFLVVDDSRAQRRILRTAIDALGLPSAIDEAEDGLQGLGKAVGGRYDLIFLDVNMPGLQGTDVLREIKRMGMRAKVVMTTADLNDDLVETIERLGGDACIKKPIAIPEVIATIAAMLDARRPARRPAA